MGGALLYYELCSRWNRVRSRLQRMKNPRYLFGGIVGGVYFYFYFFKFWFQQSPGVATFNPENRVLLEAGGALVLMGVLLLMWLIPHERAALTFTEAEVAFLFPAPIGRRTLIHFKLLKSQTAILFSALFLSLFRNWGSANGYARVIGYWGILSIVNLHLLGSSFARTMLLERGISNWRRRTLVIGVVALAAVGVFLWVRQKLPPPPDLTTGDDLSALRLYALQVVQGEPVRWLQAPFRAVVAPLFSRNVQEFGLSFAVVLGIIGLHYWWVIQSNVAFEEASIEASRKVAERRAAIRSGNWNAGAKPQKSKRPPFTLRPQGWPAVAIFWKNLISAGQLFTSRVLVLVVWGMTFAGVGMKHVNGSDALGFVAAMLIFMSLLYGPQILRHDFRQDLRMADALKLFPMAGWQVVLGEILAPAAILAGVQWALLIFAFTFCPANIGHTVITPDLRVAAVVGVGLLLPCVDFIALLLPNAAALIFPAWVQLGKDTPRGFETMGQQIILVLGQIIVLIVTMLPAALAGFGAGYAGWWLFGKAPSAAVAFGAMAAVAMLAAEAAAGVYFLGHIFERFDWSEGVE
jgi:hypothetical protein